MRRTIAASAIIARRILLQRVRDRSALIFAVLTPLGLALAFSVLIPNDFQSFHTRFVIVDDDRGPAASRLVDDAFAAVAAAGAAQVDRIATEAEARDILDAGGAGAMVVIPAGFSEAISSGTPTQIVLAGGQFPSSFEVARAVVTRFASEAGAAQLLIATATASGDPDPARVQAAVEAIAQPAPVTAAEDQTPARQAGRATFYAAAMAIMFVFFATQYGALAIHADRQGGTLTRLLAAPISPGAILMGASLASLALGLTAMTVLILGSSILVHASWGSPPLVAALVFTGVIAATGISMVVATFARTPQQAGAVNAMVALSLAAIGGVFLPLSQAPASIVTLSQITPHAWFLRGIDTLADASAGPSDILPSLLVLTGMGIALGAVGLARARRALVTP
ncbi:MAG TPA: ABC transporter permease [Candidatus Limnocylindrales bacterium]